MGVATNKTADKITENILKALPDMEENKKNDSLVESICQLMEMQDSANDYYSAGLYRAMFRNETDLNKLDHNYADHILGFAESGCKNAIEDYKNYLLYVKKLYPSVYPEYAEMLENAIKQDEKEDEE